MRGPLACGFGKRSSSKVTSRTQCRRFTSLPAAPLPAELPLVRGHWTWKTACNWVRDVHLRRRRSQIRTATGPRHAPYATSHQHPAPRRRHQHAPKPPDTAWTHSDPSHHSSPAETGLCRDLGAHQAPGGTRSLNVSVLSVAGARLGDGRHRTLQKHGAQTYFRIRRGRRHAVRVDLMAADRKQARISTAGCRLGLPRRAPRGRASTPWH